MTRRLDVTDRADVAAFAEAARQAWGRVDVIVNNAGVMPLSLMASLKVDEWDRMIDVNIKGVLYGIAAVLPEMKARGSGHVINIASIGALSVSPTAAVYCATKYAVRAISDGLRQEHRHIRVTCIHPGVVESELADTITDPAAAEAMKTYRAIALQPDAIGRAVRFAIEQPDDVDVNEIVIRPTATDEAMMVFWFSQAIANPQCKFAAIALFAGVVALTVEASCPDELRSEVHCPAGTKSFLRGHVGDSRSPYPPRSVAGRPLCRSARKPRECLPGTLRGVGKSHRLLG